MKIKKRDIKKERKYKKTTKYVTVTIKIMAINLCYCYGWSYKFLFSKTYTTTHTTLMYPFFKHNIGKK